VCSANIEGVNTATAMCDCQGTAGRTTTDTDTARLQCLSRDVSIEKECCVPGSNPCNSTGTGSFEYRISVMNTGEATLINCQVQDGSVTGTCPPAGAVPNTFSSNLGTIAPNQMASVTPPFAETLASTSCDQASVTCDLLDPNLPGTVCVHNPMSPAVCKHVTDTTTAQCNVSIPLTCRTPGFWGTHAQANPDKHNSKDITGAFLPVSVCGITLNNTDPNKCQSAQEALCVSIRGNQILQLARQLTAARLNCAASADVPGGACPDAAVQNLVNSCDQVCIDNKNASVPDINAIGDCIGELDAFNNGTTPLATGCHDRIIPGFNPPGAAGSSGDCSSSVNSPTNIFTPCP
jgi:hypothetical protein